MSEEVEAACQKWLRADDAWRVLSFVIARDPEYGRALTESGRTRSATLEGAASIELPTVTVVYEIEAHQINVIAVRFDDAPQVQKRQS